MRKCKNHNNPLSSSSGGRLYSSTPALSLFDFILETPPELEHAMQQRRATPVGTKRKVAVFFVASACVVYYSIHSAHTNAAHEQPRHAFGASPVSSSFTQATTPTASGLQGLHGSTTVPLAVGLSGSPAGGHVEELADLADSLRGFLSGVEAHLSAPEAGHASVPSVPPGGPASGDVPTAPSGGSLHDPTLVDPNYAWCAATAVRHGVRPGQSWGTLPVSDQASWRAHSCEAHLRRHRGAAAPANTPTGLRPTSTGAAPHAAEGSVAIRSSGVENAWFSGFGKGESAKPVGGAGGAEDIVASALAALSSSSVAGAAGSAPRRPAGAGGGISTPPSSDEAWCRNAMWKVARHPHSTFRLNPNLQMGVGEGLACDVMPSLRSLTCGQEARGEN